VPQKEDKAATNEGSSQKPKELSRYERTKRQRAAFRAEQEAFRREREAFTIQRAQAEAAQQARERGESYTLADVRKYLPQWKAEAEAAQPWEADYAQKQATVTAAEKEIARLEALEAQERDRSVTRVDYPVVGTPEHRAEWERAEAELATSDPEFMRSGTRLDSVLRQIMASPDGNIYRQHPRGIVAAYHRAKMELLEADLKDLQTTNSRLENELKRYQGLTGLGAGAPARVGSGSRVESLGDFAKLSTKEMRKHLLSNVQRNGSPWF
jgi:hypothetical protein